jgi:hypothetical protein
VNAVDRLWRAFAARNWPSAAAQFHPHAAVERPHDAGRLDVGELITAWRMTPDDQQIEVREMLTASKSVAVLARIRRDGTTLHCAAFYELHDGLIALGTELWVPQG